MKLLNLYLINRIFEISTFNVKVKAQCNIFSKVSFSVIWVLESLQNNTIEI